MRTLVVSFLIPALIGSGLSGCTVPRRQAAVRTREPARWVVVEKAIGHLKLESGDGVLDPQAHVLVLEPLYPEDLNWIAEVKAVDYFVEVLEVFPPGEVAPGEAVTAVVRIGGARPDHRYRVMAKTSTPDVMILGDWERTVRGASPISFRFTSLAGGRAGLSLAVEEVPAELGEY